MISVARSVAGAAAVVAVDQAAKAWVRADVAVGSTHELIPGFADLVHTENTGVSFGFLSGSSPWVVGLVSLVSLAVVLWLVGRSVAPRLQTPVAALVVGGALGNLIDRVVRGGVTDFLDLPWLPPANIADVAITAGAALMFLGLLFGPDPGGAPDRGDADGDDAPATGTRERA